MTESPNEPEEVDEELVHHPNLKDDNGLYCFLDGGRVCSADCMAYVPEPLEGSSPLSAQQQHCVVLVRGEQLARFIGGGISLFKQQRADKVRQEGKPPPDPMGTR